MLVELYKILMVITIVSFLAVGLVKDEGGMLGGLNQFIWFIIWLILNLVMWLLYFALK
jgi:hypothetical protein